MLVLGIFLNKLAMVGSIVSDEMLTGFRLGVVDLEFGAWAKEVVDAQPVRLDVATILFVHAAEPVLAVVAAINAIVGLGVVLESCKTNFTPFNTFSSARILSFSADSLPSSTRLLSRKVISDFNFAVQAARIRKTGLELLTTAGDFSLELLLLGQGNIKSPSAEALD